MVILKEAEGLVTLQVETEERLVMLQVKAEESATLQVKAERLITLRVEHNLVKRGLRPQIQLQTQMPMVPEVEEMVDVIIINIKLVHHNNNNNNKKKNII